MSKLIPSLFTIIFTYCFHKDETWPKRSELWEASYLIPWFLFAVAERRIWIFPVSCCGAPLQLKWSKEFSRWDDRCELRCGLLSLWWYDQFLAELSLSASEDFTLLLLRSSRNSSESGAVGRASETFLPHSVAIRLSAPAESSRKSRTCHWTGLALQHSTEILPIGTGLVDYTGPGFALTNGPPCAIDQTEDTVYFFNCFPGVGILLHQILFLPLATSLRFATDPHTRTVAPVTFSCRLPTANWRSLNTSY
jgi:hypothetical protein